MGRLRNSREKEHLMRHPNLRRAAATATAMAMVTAGWMGAEAAGAAPPRSTATPTGATTVTLVTGDQVTTLPGGIVNIRPAKGRENMAFTGKSDRQHQYVIPVDAMRLVSTGKIDPRLFDVKLLTSYAYDDAHRADLPLILQYDKSATPKIAGAQVSPRLAGINMAAVRESKASATSFWASVTSSDRTAKSAAAGVDKIWLDGKRKLDLSESVPQIGAPTAWAAGVTGAGVTTAVLDSGIDATHPDFAGKIVDSKDFTGSGDTDDKVGHGTHVASIITGSGAASGGKYKGVAPGTQLAVGKVCGSSFCSESAILDGMVWAAQTVRARVVNLSIGGLDTPASTRCSRCGSAPS
jgi:subtilisin family serine protease